MPFPSPVNPRPSVDVAETETGAPPSALDNAAIASARRVPIFGLLQTICTATFTISKPALLMRARVSFNSVAPDAPAYFGSDTPKLDPRSPKPVALKSASQIACAATSPSECPSTPTV